MASKGLPFRAFLIVVAWNLVGVAIGDWLNIFDSNSVALTILYFSSWMTLWSFTSLLVLPSLSHSTVFAASQSIEGAYELFKSIENNTESNFFKNRVKKTKMVNTRSKFNQGMTAVIQKNHHQAILVFENFTTRFPDNIDSDNAFYWIGRAYFELNEWEKAEESFRKVLTRYEHLPTSQGYKTSDSIYMLGKLQLQKNLEQRAIYYFEEVIKRFPGSAAARNAERDLGR